MRTDHAPAPWRVALISDGSPLPFLMDANGKALATFTVHGAAAIPELVVAAPELLAAAKDVSEFEWDRDTVSLRALRAAIAKADVEPARTIPPDSDTGALRGPAS